MNDFELFLNFGAVVEIEKYTEDLYKFCRLMLKLRIFDEHITYFINSSKILGEIKLTKDLSIQDKLDLLKKNFGEDYFWHLVYINEGNLNKICIEYQVGKGFTFGKKKDYLDYDNEIKILNVDRLIIASGYADEFLLNGKEIMLTDFNDKYEDLDEFCDFYDWRVYEYNIGNRKTLYNILDIQTNEFRFEENITLDEIIEHIFFRMFDYWTDEEDIDDLITGGDIRYIVKKTKDYLDLGINLGIFKDNEEDKCYQNYLSWFEEIKKDIIEENKDYEEIIKNIMENKDE